MFTGYLKDPSKLIHSADCLILPSHFSESLPYCIIEALACDKPVLATPVAEIPNMLSVDDYVAGGVIPFTNEGLADVEVLANNLIRMADDKVWYNSLSQYAKLAFKKFSMEECGEKYRIAYDKLLN